MTLLLVPTLKQDISNVAICPVDFYQGLLGYYLLSRHNEVLGMAIITLPRLD